MNRHELRLGITSDAREIRRNGYQPIEKDPLKQSYDTAEEAYSVWDVVMKKERFSIFADITESALTRAESRKSSRSPFGLIKQISVYPKFEVVKSVQSSDPYREISTYMQDTLRQSFGEELAYRQQLDNEGGDDPAVRTYRRFLDHVDFYNNIAPLTGKSFDYADALDPGLQAGISWMGTVAELIPAVHREQFSKEKPSVSTLQTIAKKSISFLTRLAAYDQKTFNAIGLSIATAGNVQEAGIDSTSFTLINRGRGLELAFSEEAEKRNQQFILDVEACIQQTLKVGCVALVQFETDKKNVISRTWDWYVDTLSTVYSKEF